MSWFLRTLRGGAEEAQRATSGFLRILEKGWEEVDRFMTGKSPEVTQLRFYIYRDSKGEYRWRLLARNGKIIADSGGSYKEKRNCMKAIRTIRVWSLRAKIDDRTK